MKTDQVGRVWTPIARREQLLDEFEQSGLSGRKFAALVGVKYQTFAVWAKRRRQSRQASLPTSDGNKTVRWLEAVVDQAAGTQGSGSGLVIELPGGARTHVSDKLQAALAAELLKVLACEQPSTC